MASRSPTVVPIFLCFFLSSLLSKSQECATPALICPQTTPLPGSTADGVPSQVPITFCFEEVGNAVYFEFQTLDQASFPGISFNDPSAQITLSGLSCATEPQFGQGLSMAVFAAADLCDISTFDAPVYCNALIDADELISLSNLLPSTTYYVMVSGLFGSPPSTDPASCTFNLNVSGPAVTYDLDADWFPQNNESRIPKELYDGETLVLTADPAFPDLMWNGSALNATNGSEVTANPEGVDNTFTYIVETTINGCVFTDQVMITIRPAIVPYNAFTPNGDGINDTWEIANITEWPDAQVRVYSRWGQKVFQAANYGNEWGGDDLPAATYYYVIELNPVDFNTEPYTGSVTIMR